MILLSTNQVLACQCVHLESDSKSNIEYEIEQSNWIGIGTITDLNKETYPAIYQIEIKLIFKGSKQIIKVETGLGGSDCGFYFEKGEEYIIYGNEVNDSTMVTSRCRRTNKISETADYDYLRKIFINSNIKFQWSESFTNFVQIKSHKLIDIKNPPLIIDLDFQFLTIENIISKHPTYIYIEQLEFNSKDLKKLNSNMREKAIKNGIYITKPSWQNIRKRKLIRKLNNHGLKPVYNKT
ncbi:MAG: hypothetical protein ACI8XB_002777 [Patiriisocius sp.]|jgi:hypothetical protein